MIKIKNLKDFRSYIHPILLSIYPVIFLYAENPGEIDFTEILKLLVYLLAFGLYLLGATIFFVRDTIKSSLLVSLFLIVFYSWGYVYKGLESTGIAIFSQTTIMVVTGLIYAILALLIFKTKKQLANISVVLNVVAICLVLLSTFNIAQTALDKDIALSTSGNFDYEVSRDYQNDNKFKKQRDIYYLIFDQYARADILKEAYEFDNSMFINFLEERGFYVAKKSYSNYSRTKHSLASSLNLNYINYLSSKVAEKWLWNNPEELNSLLRDYKVWRFLKYKGYKFIHFGANRGETFWNEFADENYNILTTQSNDRIVLNIIYRNSFLWPILRIFDLHEGLTVNLVKDFGLLKRESILYKFQKLKEIPDIKEPTFTFAHFLSPHPPYVFDADGNNISWYKESNKSAYERYVDQMIFTNKKIKDIIDVILERSEVKPIIVLQSDEGPYPDADEKLYINESPDKEQEHYLKHKFAILNAYYLPDTDNSILYPTITPVNTFRVIFNLYFDTDYELLPDLKYSTTYKSFTKFKDVTKKLD